MLNIWWSLILSLQSGKMFYYNSSKQFTTHTLYPASWRKSDHNWKWQFPVERFLKRLWKSFILRSLDWPINCMPRRLCNFWTFLNVSWDCISLRPIPACFNINHQGLLDQHTRAPNVLIAIENSLFERKFKIRANYPYNQNYLLESRRYHSCWFAFYFLTVSSLTKGKSLCVKERQSLVDHFTVRKPSVNAFPGFLPSLLRNAQPNMKANFILHSKNVTVNSC